MSTAPVAPVKELERVVVRFAGDSDDGVQLAGDRFTNATAILGNDLSTLPDYPAEIWAPAGTLAGVSAFQIHFADYDILTPGDAPGDPCPSLGDPRHSWARALDCPARVDDRRGHRPHAAPSSAPVRAGAPSLRRCGHVDLR